jgi:hypothetical protein
MPKMLWKVVLACCVSAMLASGIAPPASAARLQFGTGLGSDLLLTAGVDADLSPNVTNYTLTVSRIGSGTGTVTSDPSGIDCGSTCSYAYEVGTLVMLTATPTAGYAFAGWSGDGCSGTETTCWVQVSEATMVAAAFAPTHTLRVAPTGSGAGRVYIYPEGIECASVCSTAVVEGTQVELWASAESGSAFAGWSGGGCSGTEVTCSFSMDVDTTVTPSFMAARTLTVTVNESGHGYVTSTSPEFSCSYICAEEFAEGTRITLSPTPYPGYRFTGWSGGGCSGMGTCVVTLGTDAAVTATFAAIPSHILKVSETGTGKGTVSSAPAGIFCGSECSAGYEEGTTVTLSASPNYGSVFTGWSGGGCSGTGTCTVSVSADTEVTAAFSTPRQLTVDATGNGSGRIESSPAGIGCTNYCAATFEDGTRVSLTATPASGSNFIGWSGGGCGGTGSCIVTLNSSIQIVAAFSNVPAGQGERSTAGRATRQTPKSGKGSKKGATGGGETLRPAVNGKIVIHGPTDEAHLRVKRISASSLEIHGQYASQAGCSLVSGHNTLSCPIGDIKELEFIMGPSNDKVEIESPLPFPVTAHMGAGSDKFIGNDEPDTCYSEGTKRNRCIGNGGNDVCITGNLNSDCVGGSGNDLCEEGAGSDGCFGGPGDDVCIMGAGNDGCHGGPGNDRLDGGPGLDQLYGGSGHDYCDGGPGVGRSHECEAGPGD